MSLIKMITGAFTGGTGGIFDSDKEKNEGYKWKSGMDETHGGTIGLLNQATYTSPQANLHQGLITPIKEHFQAELMPL